MSAAFLTATLLRRDDSLALAASTPTSLSKTLSEQLTLTEPALRRAPSSTSTAAHAASLVGTFSFGVCDHVDDVYDLGRLAQASSVLRGEVRQLERTWMRACVEVSACLEWIERGGAALFDGSHAGWYETFGAMLACRDELINNSPLWGPSMGQANDDSCETLCWGEDEVWMRVPPSPPERQLREAFGQLMTESKDFLDGMGDPQCDTSPVALGVYTRTPGAHARDFVPKESQEAADEEEGEEEAGAEIDFWIRIDPEDPQHNPPMSLWHGISIYGHENRIGRVCRGPARDAGIEEGDAVVAVDGVDCPPPLAGPGGWTGGARFMWVAGVAAATNAPPSIHPGVACDKSGMDPIVGTRYHLSDQNYDLCEVRAKAEAGPCPPLQTHTRHPLGPWATPHSPEAPLSHPYLSPLTRGTSL